MRNFRIHPILTTLETVEAYAGQPALAPKAAEQMAANLAVAEQVRAQAVTADAAGQSTLRQGGAKDRRISVEDADMRNGRKSASRLSDGYKRHSGEVDMNRRTFPFLNGFSTEQRTLFIVCSYQAPIIQPNRCSL